MEGGTKKTYFGWPPHFFLFCVLTFSLHNQGSDRVGSAHDANQRDRCSQFLFCIHIVESLLRPPFNAKEEKEREKCQNSSICHLNGQQSLNKSLNGGGFFKKLACSQKLEKNICSAFLLEFSHPAKLLPEWQLLVRLFNLNLDSTNQLPSDDAGL